MNESGELRPETLSASGAGMTRLRTKGGASKESLYELTNGYVTASKAPTQRPGTTWKFNFANTGHTVNAGQTKGLVAFKNVLYAFTHDSTYATSGSASYVIVVLRHPTNNIAPINRIHFAQPFMGLLYVVAQFNATTDYPAGFIGHYWLQSPPSWVARTQYMDNQLVQPTVPNGFYYSAQRSINPPMWTPLLQYAQYAGPTPPQTLVQPSVYNGSYFIVNAVFGPGASLTPPLARSGSVEPNWAASGLMNGAFTLEFSTAGSPPTPTVGGAPPGSTPPGTNGQGAGGGGRYDNRYGTRPRQN